MGSIPGLVKSPGEGNGNPFQYSCLGNPMDRGAWGATVHGVTKSQTRLSAWHFHCIYMCACVCVCMYGLPWWLSGKESTCQCRRCGFDPGLEDPLEKEMATHSSILAWEIPWTEEPGGLHTVQGVATSRTRLHFHFLWCFYGLWDFNRNILL